MGNIYRRMCECAEMYSLSLSEVRILFVIVPFQGHQSVRQLWHCIYTVKRPYHHING